MWAGVLAVLYSLRWVDVGASSLQGNLVGLSTSPLGLVPSFLPTLHIPRTLLRTVVFLTLSPQPLTRSRSLADLRRTPLSVLFDVNLDFCSFF